MAVGTRYSRESEVGGWLLARKKAGFAAFEEGVNTKAGATRAAYPMFIFDRPIYRAGCTRPTWLLGRANQ